MRRFAKPILILALLLAVLTTAIVVGANLYLQSGGVQSRIRTAVSEAAGTPVDIRSMYWVPWSGLTVSGVTVRDADVRERPLLNVPSISVQFRLWPLLQGRFEVNEISVNSPVVLARRFEGGAVSRPAPADVPAEKSESAPAATPSEPASGHAATPAQHRPAPVVTLERLRIRNGTVVLDDALGRRLGSLEGISITAVPAADGSVTGRFKFRLCSWVGMANIRDASGTFFWRRDYLSIPGFAAHFAEGELTGSYEQTAAAELRFRATLKATDVALAVVASEAGWSARGTQGTLAASAELSGSAGDPQTYGGSARLDLREARIEPVEFIQQIGDLLAVDELRMLDLREARARATIGGGAVHVDEVFMQSKNLIIEAAGTAGFDGGLNLNAKLLVNDRLRKNLRAIMGGNFVDSEHSGYKALPFTVTGTVSRPKSDLLEKLTGMKIGRDGLNLLQNLMRFANPAPAKPAGGNEN